MVKRKPFIIILGLSMMLFCGSTVNAKTSVDVINEFETGIVDIELTEYQKNGDTEELWVNKAEVLPADEISKIPRIHNDGNDCYVRAKITFTGTDEVDDECLYGMTNDWVKADDGYYYYKKILPHGEDVDIFQGIKIPDNFSQNMEGNTFYIDIAVDAIQSKNFTPNFETASPWGSVEILECEKEGQYDVSTFKKSDSKAFQITYQGDSKKLIRNHEDFFDNFPYLMPGDTYSDGIDIVNNSNNDIKLYFRSEALDDSELLDKILLEITTIVDGEYKVLYSGTLRAEELSEDVILGVIPKGEKAYFDFKIEVPAELNNKYTILDSYVRWIFSTSPIEEIIETNKPTETNPPTNETISTVTTVPNVIPTGDSANVGLYMILIGISLGLFFIVCLKAVKDGKEDEGDA